MGRGRFRAAELLLSVSRDPPRCFHAVASETLAAEEDGAVAGLLAAGNYGASFTQGRDEEGKSLVCYVNAARIIKWLRHRQRTEASAVNLLTGGSPVRYTSTSVTEPSLTLGPEFPVGHAFLFQIFVNLRTSTSWPES